MHALLSIVLFVIGGLTLGLVGLGAGRLIRPKNPHPEKAEAYECGELPVGSAHVQFDLRFYVVALVYLVFAVEVVLFYPWAVAYGSADDSPAPFTTRAVALVDMLVFFALIVVGFAYLWRFGYLDWVNSEPPTRPAGTKAMKSKRLNFWVLRSCTQGRALRSSADTALSTRPWHPTLTSATLLTCVLTSAATAQLPPPSPPHPYDAAFEAMKQRNAAEHAAIQKEAAAGNADRRAWDYVFADKKAGTVTVLACGSVIKPTDPVEFFVCAADSGKDYESLSITPAKPSDIKAAMEFIGLKPGLPIDPEKNRYWPRGQRVIMTFTIAGKAVRAEDLVQDTTTQKPLPASGLVFTGSYTYRDEQGQSHFAADLLDARPIAPLYNDPAALIDVPRQAVQSVVYGFQKPSAAFSLKAGEVAELTLRAAAGHDAVREDSLAINLGYAGGKTAYTFDVGSDFKFDASRQRLIGYGESAQDLPHLLARIGELADGSRDLFTSVAVDSSVPINDLRALYAVLQAVEKDCGVKLESDGDLQPFHGAFFPKPEWRDRATRLAEPWELFLARDGGGKLVAKLERATANPDKDSGGPKQIVESSTPADPAALVKTVNDNASRWSKAIFVYPPPDLTYGELMTWVRPVLATYPRVFVFPAVDVTTQPATQPVQSTQPTH